MHSWLFRGLSVRVISAGIMGASTSRTGSGFHGAQFQIWMFPQKIKKKCSVTLPLADTHPVPHADLAGLPAAHQQPTGWLGSSQGNVTSNKGLFFFFANATSSCKSHETKLWADRSTVMKRKLLLLELRKKSRPQWKPVSEGWRSRRQ